MNSGILIKNIPLDPVTEECSRMPVKKLSWVKKLFLFIKNSSIKIKFKKIYINLLLFSIKKFLYLIVLFPKILRVFYHQYTKQKTFKKIKKPQESVSQETKEKQNRVNRLITGCLNWYTQKKGQLTTQ